MAETSEQSGVSASTIKRVEASTGVPNVMASNLESLRQTFESMGIEFIPAGKDNAPRGPGITFTPKDGKTFLEAMDHRGMSD